MLLTLLSVFGGCTKCSKTGFFLSLKEFRLCSFGRLLCLLGAGACLLPAPLFYLLVALETSHSIWCPEPDVRTPKAFGSEVEKRAMGKGGREENLN